MRPQDRRPTIDPKTLRKRSRRAPTPVAPALPVDGPERPSSSRVLAPAGSKECVAGRLKPGVQSRGFENHIRFVKANQVTETVVNPKKDREIRALEGSCFVELPHEDPEKEMMIRVRSGSDGNAAWIPAGTPHRIVALSGSVNLLITQAYKYEVAMEELAPAELSDAPEVFEGEEEAEPAFVPPANGLPPRRPRGLQKAAKQMQSHFEAHKPRQIAQAPAPVGGEIQVQVNAQPTGGRDLAARSQDG